MPVESAALGCVDELVTGTTIEVVEGGAALLPLVWERISDGNMVPTELPVPDGVVSAIGYGAFDRDLLIAMDAILVLVLSLLLYSISARDPLAPPGVFDALQLVLVVLALAVDALLLTAMVTRIAEFGTSPNKVAALGLNLLLLVHLTRAGWLTGAFLRRRVPFGACERWQTRYLPVYGLWAAVVVVAFPPLFGFV